MSEDIRVTLEYLAVEGTVDESAFDIITNGVLNGLSHTADPCMFPDKFAVEVVRRADGEV